MKILFLTTEDYSFWSHRLTLARAARQAGAEVAIMTRAGEYRSRLEAEGFRVIPWRISRPSLNPLRELGSLWQVVRAYRRERPDLIHQVALKPVVYGGIAARLCGGLPTVNTITGLGPVFSKSGPRMFLLRCGVVAALRWIFRPARCQVIVQNDDDQAFFAAQKIAAAEKMAVLPGFGVDTGHFRPRPEPQGRPVVMLPARMLWEKGVGEFVAAARLLREWEVCARMVLVGGPDPGNPGCIDGEQLREWQREGVVEWWGPQSDMPAVLAQAQVVCLPSYREGLPKILLEAAACGRAVVTTTVPGCAQAVRQGENGLLVAAKEPRGLARAIRRLLQDSGLRQRMGAAGRERALREFSDEKAARQTVELYQRMMNGQWSGSKEFGRAARIELSRQI
jgi:glycosyltransferase involved in cell wall biosynthesis